MTPITDAVIPVAGLGTRLLPATRSQPKEMLPVLDKPVVQVVVEELAEAGIERTLLITGRRKRAIEDHFDGADAPPMRFFYTRQAQPAGLGDALALAAGFAAERPVVVALGDSIIEPGAGPGIVRRLIDAYERAGASAALAVSPCPTISSRATGSSCRATPIPIPMASPSPTLSRSPSRTRWPAATP